MFTPQPDSPSPEAPVHPSADAFLGAAKHGFAAGSASGSAAGSTAASIPDRIAFEETALLYRLTPLPVMSGLGFVAAVGAPLAPSVPTGALVAWVATMLLLTWLRVTESRRFVSDPHRHARIRHWRLGYVACMVIYSARQSSCALQKSCTA